KYTRQSLGLRYGGAACDCAGFIEFWRLALDLVFNLLSRAAEGGSGGVASLDHEIRHDTMKDRAVVEPVFCFLSVDRMSPLAFPFGKLGEIRDSFGRIFFEEAADDCSFCSIEDGVSAGLTWHQ